MLRVRINAVLEWMRCFRINAMFSNKLYGFKQMLFLKKLYFLEKTMFWHRRSFFTSTYDIELCCNVVYNKQSNATQELRCRLYTIFRFIYYF